MKKKLLQEKLKNSSGASILVALFVLLVCSVISSIVVTAGMASAGRIVNVAKTDQRYYTVSSAANILKETIEDNPIVITRKYDGSDYTFSFCREIVNPTTNEKEYLYTDLKKDLGLLNDIAIDYGFAGEVDSLTGKVAENKANYDVNINELETVNLPIGYAPTTITVNVSNAAIVETKATIELTTDKHLLLKVYDGEGGVGHYNLCYTYSSDIQEHEDINENEAIATKITRLSWVLEKVEKI